MQNVQTTKTNYSVSEPLSKLNIKKKIERNFPYDQAGIEFTLLKEFFFFLKKIIQKYVGNAFRDIEILRKWYKDRIYFLNDEI